MMMKRIFAVLIVLAVMTGYCAAVYAETSPAQTTKINAHFATVEEGEELMRNRKLYHEQINEKNLAFLL